MNFQITRDYGTFKINEEEFSLSPQAENVVLNCSFASGVDAIGKNRHLRICEALGFALGQFIIPFAIDLEPHRGDHLKILRAPAYMLYPPEKRVDFPPLLFGDDMPIPEVYQMAANYYTKIRSWEVKEEHPLSSGAYRVIEALRQPIELQFLALSVAAEDLIRTAFPDIAPIDGEFANEVQQFLGRRGDEVGLSVRLKNRLDGAAKAMFEPRNSERLWEFVKCYGLGTEVYKAWKKTRNPSSHGIQILQTAEFKKLWDRRSKVLHLCHSIVLASIDYEGPRTNYTVSGCPREHWKRWNG